MLPGVVRVIALAGIVSFAAPSVSHATSHITLGTSEGVWLASDTLMTHTDANGKQTQSHVCKVVVSHARLIFNQGSFASFGVLQAQEKEIPLMPPRKTLEAVEKL